MELEPGDLLIDKHIPSHWQFGIVLEKETPTQSIKIFSPFLKRFIYVLLPLEEIDVKYSKRKSI